MSAILTVTNIQKKFSNKPVLDNINFSLEPGRILGIMGPNGAGKTTLIKILMQIYSADAGQITVCGQKITHTAKRHFSYMPDHNHLFRWMSVRDAIRYYQDMFSDFRSEKARELCAYLQVDEKEMIKTLSRGTIERVLIMLAFSRNTQIYLLDEPIAGIDPLGREKILKTILSGVNENCSVIISTHLVKDVETILDDVLFLNKGRVLLAEKTESIREEHGRSVEEHYLEVYEHV